MLDGAGMEMGGDQLEMVQVGGLVVQVGGGERESRHPRYARWCWYGRRVGASWRWCRRVPPWPAAAAGAPFIDPTSFICLPTRPPPSRLQAARRVEKVEVNYSRAAKQVDVRSLKELMWHGMHSAGPDGAPPSPDTVLGFQVGGHMQAGWRRMSGAAACLPAMPNIVCRNLLGPLPWLTPALAYPCPVPHSAPDPVHACRMCCRRCRSATPPAGWRTCQVRPRGCTPACCHRSWVSWPGMHASSPWHSSQAPHPPYLLASPLCCCPRTPPPCPAVHLCFICVLHLANEHGLVIQPVPELDRLLISNVPAEDHHQ